MRELIHHGHSVVVETKAGYGIGFDDDAYRRGGRQDRRRRADEVFAGADMIVKVKEPQPDEIARLTRPGRCSSPICISRPTPSRPRA